MQLLKLDHYVDMIIPRGGEGLQQLCKNHASIPVISGGIGVCQLFAQMVNNFVQTGFILGALVFGLALPGILFYRRKPII